MFTAARSPRAEGRLLAAEPYLLGATLPLLAYGFALALALPDAATGVAWILLFAAWPFAAAERLRRRAHAYGRWLRSEVARQGGPPLLAMPAQAQDVATVNRPQASWRLTSAEQSEVRFRRAPGRESRRWIAGFHLAWGGAGAVAFCAHGSWAIGIALGVVTLPGVFVLWTGGRRPWPDAWDIVELPSRVLGSIWIALAALYMVGIDWALYASNLSHGVKRGAAFVFLLAFAWAQRGGVERLQRIERVRGYRVAERLVERAAPFAWWCVVSVRGVLLAIALSCFWLAPLAPDALTSCSIALGLAIIISPAVTSWRRPRSPRSLTVADGARVLALPLVDRRVTYVVNAFVAVALLWNVVNA